MKSALLVALAALLILVISFFVSPPGEQKDVAASRGLPWEIATDGRGGSSVFGLSPGVSTVAEARQVLGNDAEMAIIAGPSEIGTLEAYYAQVPLGFVLGRVILTVDLPPATVAAMRERATGAEFMESTTRKIRLHAEDGAAAEQAPIGAITVIPTVDLDENVLLQRFGAPEERVAVSEKRTHLLYPSRGLDVVLDREGKELLQYVAPRDFERLRAPLRGRTPEGK